MMLLLLGIIIVASSVHRLLLNLCELNLWVLEDRLNTAIINVIFIMLGIEIYTPHILVSELVGRYIFVCVVSRAFLIRVYFFDSV